MTILKIVLSADEKERCDMSRNNGLPYIVFNKTQFEQAWPYDRAPHKKEFPEQYPCICYDKYVPYWVDGLKGEKINFQIMYFPEGADHSSFFLGFKLGLES